MKRSLLSVILTLLFLTLSAYTVEEIPNVHLTDRTRYLSNPDNIISAEAQTRADSLMSHIWQQSTAEVTAVVVNSIDGRDANDFATELFTLWGIGKKDKDNGVLLLVVNDSHDIVIRTGYGSEGVLPDILAGRIIRERMFPAFRAGDFDKGVLDGLAGISEVMTDPEAIEELKSGIPNDARARGDKETVSELLTSLLRWGLALLALMTVVLVITWSMSRNKSRAERFTAFNTLTNAALAITVGGFGIPVITYFIARHMRDKVKNEAPKCPLCGNKMRRVSRQQALQFLNPVQLTEQQIGSVSYDVWRCINDGQIETVAYPGKNQQYSRCNICGAKACAVSSRQTIHQPTRYRSGEGMETTTCRHCGNRTYRRYTIAKLATPIIIGGGGSGHGFGGGGFGGGSFGGGLTGGGGASGRW